MSTHARPPGGGAAPLVLFHTERYGYLAAEMLAGDTAQPPLFEAGAIERSWFPDGERYQRIATDVDGRDVVLVGGTGSDRDTLEVYDLASALSHYGARTLTLVIPYYGCATMERAVKPGEVVTAKTRARLLSAIPPASAGTRVILLDVHSEGIPHYFEGTVRSMHVYAQPLVVELSRRLAEQALGRPATAPDPFVLACTDAGRAKWVQRLANALGVTASFVFKRRLSGARTQITAVSAQVQGQVVIIYDDMIRTGGSLIGAAQAYRDAGAAAIGAVATHGVFPGDALAKLRQSGLFFAVATTDSHPRARELADSPEAQGFLSVASVAPLLARACEESRS